MCNLSYPALSMKGGVRLVQIWVGRNPDRAPCKVRRKYVSPTYSSLLAAEASSISAAVGTMRGKNWFGMKRSGPKAWYSSIKAPT